MRLRVALQLLAERFPKSSSGFHYILMNFDI
jgi:hypothetical protein